MDLDMTRFLHGLAGPTLDALMAAATGLGSTVVLATVVAAAVAVLAMARHPREALFLVLALCGSLVLNDILKAAFQRPRPVLEWAQPPAETSFPSGHSMNSFVVFVAIGLVIWRLAGRRAGSAAVALAIVLAFWVGASRIYLGAHWFSDVIGAYLAGALWLLVLVAAGALAWRRPQPGHSAGGAGEREAQSGRSPPAT
jgi:undecaprenyl-diphosphatase